MTRRPDSTLRSAFTLIELLVVISIIGLLMALLLPAVQRIRISGKRAQTGADISQLSAAASSFHQEFKFYPPETFTIPTRIDQPGYAILKQMYPRWNPALNADMVTIAPGSALANAGTSLQGIQCLIYFTTGPNNTGWAIDGPYAPSGGATNKKGPFYDYSGPPFVNYTHNDHFGTPYVYFGSTTGQKYGTGGSYTGTSPTGMIPLTSGAKFVNPDSCQIISLGANKQPGPGGAWAPETSPYSGGQPGADDLANFHGGTQLGSKQ